MWTDKHSITRIRWRSIILRLKSFIYDPCRRLVISVYRLTDIFRSNLKLKLKYQARSRYYSMKPLSVGTVYWMFACSMFTIHIMIMLSNDFMSEQWPTISHAQIRLKRTRRSVKQQWNIWIKSHSEPIPRTEIRIVWPLLYLAKLNEFSNSNKLLFIVIVWYLQFCFL